MMAGFVFATDCVHSDGDSITDMVDAAREISRATFLKYVDRESMAVLEEGLGYDQYLKMSKDYHVRYYKGRFRGHPAVYVDHSAIEYVFVPPEAVRDCVGSRSNPRPPSRPRSRPRSPARDNECALVGISELTDTPLSKVREVAASMPSHGYANLAEKVARSGMVWPEVENVVVKMGWSLFAIPMPRVQSVRRPTLEESELLMLPQNSDGWITVGRLISLMPSQRILIATRVKQGYHAVSWHPEKGYIDWNEGDPYAVRLDGTEVALVRETIGRRATIWRLPRDVDYREVKPRVYRKENRTFRVAHPERRVLWCAALLKPGTAQHDQNERRSLMLRDLIGPKWRAWAQQHGYIES